MEEHVEATRNQQETDAKAPPPAPSVIDPSQAQPDPTSKESSGNKKMSKSEKIMVWATCVIAAGTLVSAIAICFQWREMVNGGTDTTAIKIAAQQQACAAQQFAQSAGHINQGVGFAAQELRQQAQNAERFFREDERAWLDIEPIVPKEDGIEIHPAPGVNKPIIKTFRYPIYLKNVGKTIAKNVMVKAAILQSSNDLYSDAIQIEKAQENIVHHREKPSSPNQEQPNIVSRVIGPNSITPAPFIMGGFTPDESSNSKLPINFTYLMGKIDYDDGFGVHHWLKFCFFIGYSGELTSCAYGNDQDKNRERRIGQLPKYHIFSSSTRQ